MLYIPPPKKAGELSLNVQLVTAGLLPTLYIPPPPRSAELPLNVQLVTAGLPPLLYIPPPRSAELPLNVQLVTVGLLLLELYIPPPALFGKAPLALPAVMVKPSRTAVASVPLPVTTW